MELSSMRVDYVVFKPKAGKGQLDLVRELSV